MRRYTRTHPWLTFSADLRLARPDLWIALGEARSKCEHLARTPLLPAVAEHLHTMLVIKGVLATTAIEGNTLSEDEVRQRLEGKLTLPPSKEYLAQEIDNIIAATNAIGSDALSGANVELSVSRIRQYNRMVLNGLQLDGRVVPGEIRYHDVSVASYVGPPAADCEFLLGRMCEWLNAPSFCPPGGDALIMGIVRAVLAHLYIAWIHPFGDGNGRTARLIEFQVLISAGAPTAAAHLLSNHYNQTRSEYYRQLDAASRSSKVLPFLEYAVTGFVNGLREQLRIVRLQQMAIAWRDNLQAVFHNRSSKTEQRRHALALAISEAGRPVAAADAHGLAPELARMYAARTHRTVLRDLAALEDRGLIVRGPAGYSPNWALLEAFVPARREG